MIHMKIYERTFDRLSKGCREIYSIRAQSYSCQCRWCACTTNSGCCKHAVKHVSSTQQGGGMSADPVQIRCQLDAIEELLSPPGSSDISYGRGQGMAVEIRGKWRVWEGDRVICHTLCLLLGRAARHEPFQACAHSLAFQHPVLMEYAFQ